MMLILGSHVSFSSKQLLGCTKFALAYGANAFMFYTGAPQNTIRKPIIEMYTKEAKELMKKNNISLENVFCHAPYIINLANSKEMSKYQFSITFLKGEITRCRQMGIKYLIVHPGSAVTHKKSEAINNIINALNLALKPENEIMILLETMSGKGSECGINIQELKSIIDGVKNPDRIGVTLDTCHLHDAGVDLNNFDEYLKEFDKQIGLDKIKCIHINDSKNAKGMAKDRHANIGYGEIGFASLLKIIYHEQLKDVPKILETPYIEDICPYEWEIKMIKEQIFNPNLVTDVINN